MKENEKKVQESASFYTEQILNIDYKQTEFVYRSVKPFFKGRLALELGPASGYMTKYLVNDFDSLHLIEGSLDLLDQIPAYDNVIKHHSMFEDFNTSLKFDTIIMSHVLEHIEQPVSVLQKIKTWLAKEGIFVISVPNAKSIHRMVAVKMGLLKTENTLNERDHSLGHYRVYDMETLCADINAAGYKILHKGGSFLKPISNGQIEQYWTPEMVDGFFEVGKQFPENCAEIFVVCTQ
jgi:SAM-dependent methyltransferase